MGNASANNTKKITIKELFPNLSEKDLSEVGEALDGYCEIILRIFERLERERHFDDGASAS